MYILGSGLAGCLAAIQNDRARVLEASSSPNINHKALLRMRTESVSHLTGITFKKVNILKYIYDVFSGQFRTFADPRDITGYSLKVTKSLTNRSIIDLAPETRYIPPTNFHQQLLDRLDGRILYGHKITNITPEYITAGDRMIDRQGVPIISTIPMPAILGAIDSPYISVSVQNSSPIFVSRFLISNCDMYMTVYYPSHTTPVYRATIQGDVLTIESMTEINSNDVEYIISTFGRIDAAETIDFNFRQAFGKMTNINEEIRKNIIYGLTQNYNVYSLGRFACWRHILLDDVVNDIRQINKMMTTHPYERALA